MSDTIPAIYESGVFRPLEPVELAEGTQVRVEVPADAEAAHDELSPAALSQQRAAIEDMLSEIESLPINEFHDGFTGRDHDKILYGGQ